jgi:hypothetical protein
MLNSTDFRGSLSTERFPSLRVLSVGYTSEGYQPSADLGQCLTHNTYPTDPSVRRRFDGFSPSRQEAEAPTPCLGSESKSRFQIRARIGESEEIISFQGKALRPNPLEDQARPTWLNRTSGKALGRCRPHSPWEGCHLDIYPSPGRGIRCPIHQIPRWARGLRRGQWLGSVALQVIGETSSDEQPGIKPPISGRQTPPLGLLVP